MGLIAALCGLVDWRAIPGVTRAKAVGAMHGRGNAVVVVLFVVSWLLRIGNPEHSGMIACVSHSSPPCWPPSPDGLEGNSWSGFESVSTMARPGAPSTAPTPQFACRRQHRIRSITARAVYPLAIGCNPREAGTTVPSRNATTAHAIPMPAI